MGRGVVARDWACRFCFVRNKGLTQSAQRKSTEGTEKDGTEKDGTEKDGTEKDGTEKDGLA
jgi:hypothetical protein